jgi:hypothetical protein
MTRPTGKLTQNLLKLEVSIRNASVSDSVTLRFQLHVTIRICKANYLNVRSGQLLQTVGDQSFYMTPEF